MDEQKFRKKEVKAARTLDIKFGKQYVNPSFTVEVLANSQASPTGRLDVLLVESADRSSPMFRGRWDEADGIVDFDIDNVNDQVKRDFVSGKIGYRGHHTTKIKDGVFRIAIEVPGVGRVLEGELTVGIGKEVQKKDKIELRDSVLFKLN